MANSGDPEDATFRGFWSGSALLPNFPFGGFPAKTGYESLTFKFSTKMVVEALIRSDLAGAYNEYPQRVYVFMKKSGPSCSKLTMSLVNDSLKFTSSDTQIH